METGAKTKTWESLDFVFTACKPLDGEVVEIGEKFSNGSDHPAAALANIPLFKKMKTDHSLAYQA
ncbi:hypothetical protein D4768_12105 [Rhodococcus erythropolis]|nr:hypothetical protein D4768_12105 [Rhodococcus erythropolis]